MTKEQLIEVYNPANARNLTPEQINAMQNLTMEEIAILAEAFPNKPRGNAYLVLFDKRLPANKQLFPLSTWQNLLNAVKYANQKHLVAYGFKQHLVKTTEAVRSATGGKIVRQSAERKVVDLDQKEAIAGLQAAAAEAGVNEKKTEEVKDEAPVVNENPQAEANGLDETPVVSPEEAVAELKAAAASEKENAPATKPAGNKPGPKPAAKPAAKAAEKK